MKLIPLREFGKTNEAISSIQYFIVIGDDIYMLAQVGYLVYCLVNLQNGNRYTDPVKLEPMSWSGCTIATKDLARLLNNSDLNVNLIKRSDVKFDGFCFIW